LSNYVKSTDFASKDALLTGNPAKIIKGTEIDTEFNDISTAISTKADTASPTFTGTPAAPTAAGGTNTTQIATTAFVGAEISADLTTERSATATLTNKTIDLANNTVTGTVAEFNTALSDGDFATIAGTETLTNKTLTSPTINSPTLVTPAVDVINESTSAAGVTIDGVLIKDSAISGQYTPVFRDTSQATTSGTSFDFTGIPSWVQRITVIFSSVSINATDQFLIQIGDAGGIETSGYVSRSSEGGDNSTSTSGYIVRINGSVQEASGILTIINVSGNTWISSHVVDRGASSTSVGAGSKTLSDVLTQIRLTTPLGSSFDNGSVNILYE
jgi:hypothetical protein